MKVRPSSDFKSLATDGSLWTTLSAWTTSPASSGLASEPVEPGAGERGDDLAFVAPGGFTDDQRGRQRREGRDQLRVACGVIRDRGGHDAPHRVQIQRRLRDIDPHKARHRSLPRGSRLPPGPGLA